MAYDRIFRRCYTLLIFILFSALYSTAADWLCFTAETATARLWCNEYAEKLNVEYSLDDGQTWHSIPTSSSNNNYPSDGTIPSDAITLSKGEKVYVRGLYDGARFSGTNNVTFGMSGEMAVTGNVMSLVDREGKATEIPTDYCFCALFRYCRGLTHAPELPATVLTKGCYLDMFYKCSKLTEAPDLPATEVKEECYRSMFRECSGLTKAPDLPARDLVSNCYYRMFEDCSNLNYVRVGALELDPRYDGGTYRWMDGATRGSGTFLLPCGSTYTTTGESAIPSGFTIEHYAVVVFMNADKTELQRDTLACGELPAYRGKTPTLNGKTAVKWDKEILPTTEPVEYYMAIYDPDLPGNCLCLTAVEAGSTVSYANINNSPDVQYTIDGGYTWSTLNEGQKVTLKDVGDKVYIRGYNPEGFSKNANSYTRLVLQGDIAASGSVMSLIDGKGDVTEIPSTCCFLDLFLGCKALTKAPELTATVLNDSCYWSMFDNCTSLTEAPELPVKELKQNCYDKMFYGCSALTKAPELPATKMEAGCYEKMFYGCSSLTKAPELPATQLAERCYNEMFLGCKKLTEAPELPATTLETGCYRGMFSNCAGLTEAPKLMAGSLTKDCYRNMFENCSSLNYIEVGVMTLDNNFNATSNWVKGVDGPGLFVFPCGSKYDKHGSSEVPTNFTIKSSPIVIFQYDNGDELYRDTINCGDIPVYKGETPYKEHSLFKGWDKALDVINDPDVYYYTAIFEEMDDWLCFTAEEDGSVFWYENKGENEPNVQYSEDGGYTWKKLLADERVTISKKGEKVYLRGNNPKGFSHSADNRSVFSMKGHIAASGTVMSLIDEKGVTTKIPSSHCFRGLFEGCADLTQAPKLTATELASSCYASMFGRCTGLTEAPELPATEMASSCYYYMFTGCTNIKEAPKLPATKLATACYFCMFIRCTSLTETPELPLTELKTSCYQGMFQECTSLTKAPELPAVVMEKNCYTDMFHGCTSLVKAPSLPATTLAESCYHNLFYGCTSLTDAPELPATELAVDCYNSMFEGCTSLTEAPKLMALTFAENCYEEMFKGCSSLNYIEVGVMSLDNDVNATLNWVDGVDGPGLFVFPCGSKYDKHGVSEVPMDFTIKASPIVVFLNQDDTELYRDTIGCDVMPEYRGETPTMGDDYEFVGWDPELTIHETPGTYYYKALYEEVVPVEGKWLCFTSEEAGSEIWYVNGAQNLPKMQYSFNGVKWYDWQEDEHILFKYEDLKIYVRGDNPDGFSHDNSSNDANGTGATNTRFKMSGRIAASGSVMSLIDGEGTSTKIPCDYCFSDLFRNCDALTKAPELPATELAPNCYALMFQGCTNLTNVPELPATELATRCYISMFLNCSSLVDVPATLPATKLERGCYWGMFGYCSSLIKSPELPATELAPRCYNSMFIGCESLTDVPELPATELKDSCYFNMFSGCTSIVKAPELLATSLMDGCYSGMFNGCTSLNYIKVGVMTLDNNFDATKDWVEGIDGEGLFIFPCGSKYDKHGQSEVPTNFTIVSSPIVVFLNANEEELYRDTIGCDV
ncbi:MAG: leucine-rich repeat protein, partial [Paludibacteraceae bacterium]|nr:leucine-rich repeat protein [Paludibacteraceae bacterium]